MRSGRRPPLPADNNLDEDNVRRFVEHQEILAASRVLIAGRSRAASIPEMAALRVEQPSLRPSRRGVERIHQPDTTDDLPGVHVLCQELIAAT